jgi:hypothetical protein
MQNASPVVVHLLVVGLFRSGFGILAFLVRARDNRSQIQDLRALSSVNKVNRRVPVGHVPGSSALSRRRPVWGLWFKLVRIQSLGFGV